MKRSRSSRMAGITRLLWLLEFLLIMLAVAVASWLRFSNEDLVLAQYLQALPLRAALVAVFLTGAMLSFGLYQVHLRIGQRDFVLRLIFAFIFGGIALLVCYYVLPQMYIGRGVLAIALTLALLCILIARAVFVRMFDSQLVKMRVLVCGAGRNASLINQRFRRASDRRTVNIVGFVPAPGQQVMVDEDQLLDGSRPMQELVEELDVDEVIIALDERRGGLPIGEMLACVQRGLRITDLSTFFEREAGMVQLAVADPSWLVFSGGFDASMPRRVSKRLFDLVAASALLLVTLPAMLLVAICVRLESRGPVLYRQTRVGEHGEHFEVIKFRSMRVDAEADGKARWASKNDDRSTRVGKFIRRTRLDELPQLLLVMSGRMSFVGPRPERPQFVEMLSESIRYYDVRHAVKPGLTGWAQLRYPYGASVEDAGEKLKYDLYYVKNHGLVFDIMILLQTVEVVLFGRGVR